jgi:hypothetical protein
MQSYKCVSKKERFIYNVITVVDVVLSLPSVMMVALYSCLVVVMLLFLLYRHSPLLPLLQYLFRLSVNVDKLQTFKLDILCVLDFFRQDLASKHIKHAKIRSLLADTLVASNAVFFD